jgi:hypothetical protein
MEGVRHKLIGLRLNEKIYCCWLYPRRETALVEQHHGLLKELWSKDGS